MPSISDLMKEIKGGIAAEDSKIKQVQAEVLVGLGEDKPESIQGIRDALGVIETYFQQEQIPYKTIEVGLNSVMKLLKQYEDVALELEDEDIAKIVQGYMALSDEEVRSIFDKAQRKGKAKPKSTDATTKRVLAAAKEGNIELDADTLIL